MSLTVGDGSVEFMAFSSLAAIGVWLIWKAQRSQEPPYGEQHP